MRAHQRPRVKRRHALITWINTYQASALGGYSLSTNPADWIVDSVIAGAEVADPTKRTSLGTRFSNLSLLADAAPCAAAP